MVLAIMSKLVSEEERGVMAKAILELPRDQLKKGKMEMKPLVPAITLASRIGPQSTDFFHALRVGTTWLAEPVETWSDIPAFLKLQSFARNLPVSNDATERMIKRVSDFADYGGKSEIDFQSTLHTANAGIAHVPDHTTKKALAQAYSKTE